MMLWPTNVDVRMIWSISSWLLRSRANLKRYSVGSNVMVRGRAERSKQWTVLSLMRVR